MKNNEKNPVSSQSLKQALKYSLTIEMLTSQQVTLDLKGVRRTEAQKVLRA